MNHNFPTGRKTNISLSWEASFRSPSTGLWADRADSKWASWLQVIEVSLSFHLWSGFGLRLFAIWNLVSFLQMPWIMLGFFFVILRGQYNRLWFCTSSCGSVCSAWQGPWAVRRSVVPSEALPCLRLKESVGRKLQMFVAAALRVGISQEESNDITDRFFKNEELTQKPGWY